MTMLFSQRDRDVREDATISGMNEGQSLGHACLRICESALVFCIHWPSQLTDLYEDEIELVEVSLFSPHPCFVRSDIDIDLDNEVSDTCA